MRKWKAGLLAAVVLGVAGFGCGGVEMEMEEEAEASSGATEEYLSELRAADPKQCGKAFCRTVTRDKNITHLFFDFQGCKMEAGDFKVTVNGEDFTRRLKSKGGPCAELDADFRIELPGSAKTAKVCVTFTKRISEGFRIGAKAANSCLYEGGSKSALGRDDGKQCTACKK